MPSASSSSGGSAGNPAATSYANQQGFAPTSTKEAAWYEHEERMRPSYIHQHAPQPLAPTSHYNQQYPAQPRAQPPVSPSAYAQHAYAHQYPVHQQQQQRASPAYATQMPPPHLQYTQQQQPMHYQQLQSPQRHAHPASSPSSRPPPSPSAKYANPHLNSAPSRFAANPNYRDSDELPRSTVKGSAFMHKGFWDIMSLVNNQAPSPGRLAPPSNAQRPSSPGKFRATLSKASGALRKNNNDSFHAGPEYGAQAAYPLTGNASPRTPSSPVKDASTAAVPGAYPRPSFASPSTHTANASAVSAALNFFTPAAMGPRAQKKRISVDMVGSPQTQTFVHAAHASDAEQAEVILNRWSRDGVGKVADPSWVEPIKEALRLQAARNQAEAIAQVQAAMHQDSLIHDNPRSAPHCQRRAQPDLHAHHHHRHRWPQHPLQHHHPRSFGLAPRTFPHAREQALCRHRRGAAFFHRRRARGGYPCPAPAWQNTLTTRLQAATLRTNTAGTLLVNPSPPVARDGNVPTPDYMQYRPPSPHAATPGASNRNSRNIDGLPSGAPHAINAMFETPSLQPANANAERPNSMVILDSLRSIDTAGMSSLADFTQPSAPPCAPRSRLWKRAWRPRSTLRISTTAS